MRHWFYALVALAVLAAFSFGCAEITNERKAKCPKCGPDIAMYGDLK